MDNVFVAAQHRNHQYYYSVGRTQVISDGLISSPSKGFKGIDTLSFVDTTTGILSSPTTTTPPFNTPPSSSLKNSRRSKPMAIMSSSKLPNMNQTLFGDDLLSSELWAGPTYSNSPPPSSLPIPKFSLCQKRSVSFEIPAPLGHHAGKFHPISKSAPSSPTRNSSPSSTSTTSGFLFNNAYATENLRRILHLDATDD